ncbi:MAG: hypothetical protein AUJ39_00715 [Parcubacteria group bacterium CG1_02_42_13]|nr:MAG: hypothetical protein AUJ39_00715 [Parcubacteria group bacterium CG1_02_42_13]
MANEGEAGTAGAPPSGGATKFRRVPRSEPRIISLCRRAVGGENRVFYFTGMHNRGSGRGVAVRPREEGKYSLTNAMRED